MRVTKILISAAFAASIATSSVAGGFSPAIETPVVIVEPEQERSTWGIVIPLILVIGLICLATCGSDDDEPTAPAPT